METADANSSRLILANDPDADRLAVAERGQSGWRIFNGNEIGAMLGAWALLKFRESNPNEPSENCIVINSTVSSKMLAAIAAANGVSYAETLTGFKWIGNVAFNEMKRGKKFVFGFEEAIGFLVGDMSLDKDGVRGAAVFAELAIQLDKQSKSCAQYLDELYAKYGYFATKNHYFFNHDPAKLPVIFDAMRNGGQYHKAVGRFAVKTIRDLTEGFDSAQPDGKPILPVSRSTQMITYFFENGAIATLRGSGTEPKLKYYVELSGEFAQRGHVEETLNELVRDIIATLLQPERFGLVAPKE
jgi:phosphomannomutase